MDGAVALQVQACPPWCPTLSEASRSNRAGVTGALQLMRQGVSQDSPPVGVLVAQDTS